MPYAKGQDQEVYCRPIPIPKRVLLEARRLITKSKRIRSRLDFATPSLIPNTLKIGFDNRSVHILKYNTSNSVSLPIVPQFSGAPGVVIRVILGRIRIFFESKEETYKWILNCGFSYQLPPSSVRVKCRPLLRASETFIVMIEVPRGDWTSSTSINERPDLFPRRYGKDTLWKWIRHRNSFRQKEQDLETEEKLMIFLDAEFGTAENGTLVPVQVTLLDIHGKSLLNTVVTPRGYVRNFGTKYHGLRETDVYGQLDEDDCVEQIRMLIQQKILVGCDLFNDIKALRIPITEILGTEDISTLLSRMNNGVAQSTSLKKIAKEILGEDIQQGYHSSYSDADDVRRIYLATRDWRRPVSYREDNLIDLTTDEDEFDRPKEINIGDESMESQSSYQNEETMKMSQEDLPMSPRRNTKTYRKVDIDEESSENQSIQSEEATEGNFQEIILTNTRDTVEIQSLEQKEEDGQPMVERTHHDEELIPRIMNIGGQDHYLTMITYVSKNGDTYQRKFSSCIRE